MSSLQNLSTSDAGITDPGLKRSPWELKDFVDSGSGSNKKPRLDPSYVKLAAPDFIYSMALGHVRVKRLLSKNGAALNEKLNELEPCFGDFFTSVEKLRNKDDATNITGLVALAKRILEDWEDIEKVIGQQELSSASWLDMAPSDYPHAVPSAWLFEYSWRDKAYEEVLSIKKKYSHLLDQAYLDIFRAYSENKVSGSTTLSHKKLLNFLASTKEDIGFLTQEKCYQRVMSIKRLSTRRDLVSLYASCNNLTDEAQLPGWRDEIYDQIQALRKMYSLELDSELLVVDGKQSGTLDEGKKARRRSFIEKSLQFLAHSRADIVFFSEGYCRKRLADIQLFIGGSDYVPVETSTGLSSDEAHCITNWRDVAYEKLQYKADRFSYQVYDVYLTYKVTWSKIPKLAEQFRKLEGHLKNALDFYEMPRARMSSLESSRDYFKLLNSITGDVGESICLIKELLLGLGEKGTESNWDCRADKLIPKWSKSLVFV